MLLARDHVKSHFNDVISKSGSNVHLKFTFDGNLIGYIGEALAVELFGIRLIQSASAEGIDGYARDGRTVQIKATGTDRGPAFRNTQVRADHLIFFSLDFDALRGTVIFNGPEHYAFCLLKQGFVGQRSLTKNQISKANLMVADHERLSCL